MSWRSNWRQTRRARRQCGWWFGLAMLVACSDATTKPAAGSPDQDSPQDSSMDDAGPQDAGDDRSMDSADGDDSPRDRDASMSAGDGGAAPNAGAAVVCVQGTHAVQRTEVDMYIMLDRSASMLEESGAGATKWDAVRTAITSFIAEPASAGMGVGLQYFPLGTPGVPEACRTDAQCGNNGGACQNRMCVPATPDAAQFAPCITAEDCAPGSRGCMPFGTCSLDSGLACFALGPNGCDSMGDCVPFVGECAGFASCIAADYALPAVPIGTLPGSAAALQDSLSVTMPLGLTPTQPALEGAIEHARDQAVQHPARRAITVLATDGQPTTCGAADSGSADDAIEAVAQVAAQGLAGTPPVETHVIGVLSPDDSNGMQHLEAIAAAGGGKPPLIVDPAQDVDAQFRGALDAIRRDALSCRFDLPQAPDGETLDLDSVKLTLRSGDGVRTVSAVEGSEDCDTGTLGWFFADAGNAAPHAIELCGSACDALHAAADGELRLQIDCEL